MIKGSRISKEKKDGQMGVFRTRKKTRKGWDYIIISRISNLQ